MFFLYLKDYFIISDKIIIHLKNKFNFLKKYPSLVNLYQSYIKAFFEFFLFKKATFFKVDIPLFF